YLGLEGRGLESCSGECVSAGEQLTLVPRLTLADERQREVCEWREVAARADRPATGHSWENAPLQAFQQQLDRLDPRAGVPLRERIGAQQHRGADNLAGIRLPDTAGVTPQESQLELSRLLLGNRGRDEAPEAGIDPVRVLTRTVRRALDEVACGAHLRARLVGERRVRRLDCDRPDVLDPEIVSGQADRGRLSHRAASLAL